MKTTAFFSTLAVLWDLCSAGHLSVIGRSRSQALGVVRRGILRGNVELNNTDDVQYTTNITLGGLNFPVLIDTGSSDLWVASSVPIPGAVSTGASSGVEYAVGSVEGPVQLAPLVFAGHTVPRQAYIFAPPDDENLNGTGLIGLGPSIGSNILQELNSSVGNTPLDNIFIQNVSTPNFITIRLGRANQPGAPFPGDITVGEILPGYEAVTSQPKLNVTVVSLAAYGNQHWQASLDEDGIIGPNGNPIPVTSVVSPSPNPRRLLAVFDSGFTLPQIPKIASDAIYGSFPQAEFVNLTDGPIWTLPCTTEVNIAFKFSNVTYHVHPLDAVMEPEDLGYRPFKNNQGVSMCFGAFQPISFDTNNSYDMILGMGFMRNTYTYINFGDFIAGSPADRADPYIQLLSTTNDTAKAQSEFIQARSGSRTTGSSSARPTGSRSGSVSCHDPRKQRNLIIIAVSCTVGALVSSLL